MAYVRGSGGNPTGVTSINGQTGDLTIPTTTDATTSAKGIVQLAGDLAGTAVSPTVPGLTNKLDKTLYDAKGDILVATADNTAAKVTVGTNGQILSADSTASTGVRWIPLVRDSWESLNLDKDLAAYYDNTYHHWSGAIDHLLSSLAEGGSWSIDNSVDHPVAKTVLLATKSQQKFYAMGDGPFWAYLDDSAGYVKGGRFTPISASVANGLGVSGRANGFIGTAVCSIPDYSNNGGVQVNNPQVHGLAIDCQSRKTAEGTPADIAGLTIEGLVEGAMVSNVVISQPSGHGFYEPTVAGRWPRGGWRTFMRIYSAGNSSGNALQDQWGAFFQLTDGWVDHIWVNGGSGAGGVQIKNPGQLSIGQITSVFNAGTQVLFSGGDGTLATGNGGCSANQITTDAGDGVSLLITATGRQRINIQSADLRRGGRNGNTGADGTDKAADPTGIYSAVELRGASGANVCPVNIDNLSIAVEDDDTNNKLWSPQVAIRANQYITRLTVSGDNIWAYGQATDIDSAVLDLVKIGDEVTSFYVGKPTSKTNAFPDIKRGKTRSTMIFSAQTTFTGMTLAESTWGSLSNSRLRESATDLRGQSYARIGAKINTASTSSNTPVIYAQASTDSGSTWTTLTGTVNIVSGVGGTSAFSGWLAIPPAMKTDVILRCAAAGGDGSAAPSISDVLLQSRP